MRYAQKSDAAHLDQAGKRLGGARQQPSADGFEMDAIVGDQPREAQSAGARRFEQFEREPRFSGS